MKIPQVRGHSPRPLYIYNFGYKVTNTLLYIYFFF
jgi:hypothetical protein